VVTLLWPQQFPVGNKIIIIAHSNSLFMDIIACLHITLSVSKIKR
jgi:hypothetical protein